MGFVVLFFLQCLTASVRVKVTVCVISEVG